MPGGRCRRALACLACVKRTVTHPRWVTTPGQRLPRFAGDAVPTVDPATLTIEGGDSHALEIYLFVFAIFFVISFPLTRLAAYLERRLV